MTIEQIQKKLEEIQGLSEGKRSEPLIKIAAEIGAYYIPADGAADTYTLYHNIHTYLQSEMMLNACTSAETSSDLAKQSCSSAKWCCFWAFIAAIAACITVILTWCLR